MILTWLNNDELREIGWSDHHIFSGLVGQVAAFFFVKDEGDVYNVRRNFIRGSYDCEENVTFRGEKWAALITTWIV
jgi:hypothetical protein